MRLARFQEQSLRGLGSFRQILDFLVDRGAPVGIRWWLWFVPCWSLILKPWCTARLVSPDPWSSKLSCCHHHNRSWSWWLALLDLDSDGGRQCVDPWSQGPGARRGSFIKQTAEAGCWTASNANRERGLPPCAAVELPSMKPSPANDIWLGFWSFANNMLSMKPSHENNMNSMKYICPGMWGRWSKKTTEY